MESQQHRANIFPVEKVRVILTAEESGIGANGQRVRSTLMSWSKSIVAAVVKLLLAPGQLVGVLRKQHIDTFHNCRHSRYQ